MKKLAFLMALVLLLLAMMPVAAISVQSEEGDTDPIVHFDFSSLDSFSSADAAAENGVVTVGLNTSTAKQTGWLSTGAVGAVNACTDLTVFTAVKLSGDTDTWITLLTLGKSSDTLLRIMAKNNTIYAQHSFDSTKTTKAYTFEPDQWVWLACTVDYSADLSKLTLSLYASYDMGKTWTAPYQVTDAVADIKPEDVELLCVGKGLNQNATAEANYAFSLDDIRIYDKALSADEIQTISLIPVANINIQTRKGSTSNTMDARFLATVDSLRYENAGFEIAMNYQENGQSKTKQVAYTASVVYESVIAAGVTVTASEMGGRYLMAYIVTDIPANLDVEFEVKAFATENGTKTYTDTYSIPLEKLKGYSHWKLDSIGENNVLTDSAGTKDAIAQHCVVDVDAAVGSSLLLQPAEGGNISFGTDISDTLQNSGAMTFAFWYYPKTVMLHRNTLLQLSMQDGKAGVAVWIKNKVLTVSCRSNINSETVTKEYAYDGWGSWNHLAIALDYKNGTVRVYQNGVELVSNDGYDTLGFDETSYDPGVPKYDDVFGGVTDTHFSSYLFSGKVDEIYLYSHTLNADEIAELYEQKTGNSLAETQASLYEQLRTLTQDNMVLSVGSNIVLTGEDRRTLVPGDTVPVVLKEGESYYAPVEAFAAYCGSAYARINAAEMEEIERAGVKYWSLGVFAEVASIQMVVSGEQIILGPKTATAALKEFIADYYRGTLESLPVPEQDVWDTRVEIERRTKPASPSITALSDGTLLAGYDYSSGGYWYTAVERSVDGGKTWTLRTTVKNLFWATIFCIDDTVYLMGVETTSETNCEKVAITKSTDGGSTWSSLSRVDRTVQQAHHAPTPAVVHNGRVYIAFEERKNDNGVNNGFRTYQSYMMSAPVDADLTKAESWTKSELVGIDFQNFDASLYYGASNSGFGICEGNAVAGPDGMYIITRIESDPTSGLAYVLKLGDDNTTLSFHKVIELPVGKDKFVIRYDESTQKYIAIGNVKEGGSYPTQRNILAMYWSTDLENWNYGATLISDNTLNLPEITAAYYGYQYPDFLIVGDDILMVVREASGTTTYFHDANCITFYTVTDYKQFLQK